MLTTNLDVSGLTFSQKEDTIRHFLKLGNLKVAITEKKTKLRLFISQCQKVCEFLPRSSTKGSICDNNDINKIATLTITKTLSKEEAEAIKLEKRRKLIAKLKTEAKKATFSNKFIRAVLAADPEKTLYENRIGTGSPKEGSLISVQRICKYIGWEKEALLNALENQTPFESCRFPMDGYECTVVLDFDKHGEFCGHFSKEYKDTLNGYYCLLINTKQFMMYEKD